MELPWKNETEFYDMHAKEIFSKFAFYHTSIIGNEKEFLNYIVKKARIALGSRVLDMGCGSGYLVNELNEFCDVLGISTSEEAIKQCRTNHPKCNFIQGNMETFYYPESTHIISLESLGYANLTKTFRNAFNNLKKGGVFYIKEICIRDKENAEEEENRKYWECYWKYFGRTAIEIIKTAIDAGFTLLEFNDLSGKTSNKLYKETLKFNRAEYSPPFKTEFLIPAEFLFIKK